MKKVLSFLLAVCILLTMMTIPTFAATNIKLSATELNIVKAYQKTIETSDAQYLNKYKYPGVTFKVDEPGEGEYTKILNPKYTKVYDSKKKMYKLCVNGLLVVTNGEYLGLTKTPSQLYIKTLKNKVYAYQEADSGDPKMLEVDELSENETLSVETYLTSIYDEDTANALMYPDDSQGEGTEDEPGSTIDVDHDPDSGSNSNPSSVSSATLTSPVKLNNKYTWSETKKCLDDTISGTYSFTVKGVKKITIDEVEKLGFKRPKADDKSEYALIDVKWEVKDAKIVKGTEDLYLNVGWDLDIWGVKTPDGASIIGATDYGFDGSFSEDMDKVTDLKKLSPGMTKSFTAEGKVLVTLYKNKTNYLALKNESIEDYNSSFMYFDLNGAGGTSNSSSISQKDDKEDKDDEDDTVTSSNTTPASSGTGTVGSPVEINQKYTWSVTDKQYAYDLISGTFSLTVKNSKKVTADDIVKLGFKKPTDSDKVDYYLVNVLWEVKNAKLKKGEKGSGYGYLSGGWDLSVWGTKTADGDSYIGGCTDYGFDGSIGRAMSKVDKKITPGMNESCKAEGTMLLSVPKGKTSYMVVRNDSIEDYDSSFIYFKVK